MLEDITRKGTCAARKLKRAPILLKAAARWKDEAIMEALEGAIQTDAVLDRSSSLLDAALPRGFPPMIGPVQTQGQQVFRVAGQPPGTGAFQSLLNDGPVRAFDLPGADRPSFLRSALIIQLPEAVREVAVAAAHERLRVGHRLRGCMGTSH